MGYLRQKHKIRIRDFQLFISWELQDILNQEEMYKSLGYDMFYDASFYNMTEENVINYGLKDKPFFKETIPF